MASLYLSNKYHDPDTRYKAACGETADEFAAKVDFSGDILPLQLRHTIGFNGEPRNGLLVHPEGQHLVYSVGSNIIIEDITGQTAGTQKMMSGHTNNITALAFSNDGRFLASGQEIPHECKAIVILWDWCTRQQLMHKALHKVKVEALTFLCSTKHFVSLGGPDDMNIIVWSAKDKGPVCGKEASVTRAGITHCIAASKVDEKTFVTAGDTYGRVWTFNPDEKSLNYVELKFGGFSRIIICVEVCDSDSTKLPLIFCGTTTGDVMVFHIKTGHLQFVVPQKPLAKGITALAYTRMLDDNTFCLLVGTGEGKVGYYTINYCVNNKQKVFGKMKPYQGLQPLNDERDKSSITSISKVGAGHQFYVGTKDCNIYRFNLAKWTSELVRTCSNCHIHDLVFPRGTDELMITAQFEMVRVLNLRMLLEVRRYVRSNRTCMSVAINHDGIHIFSGWDDGAVIVLGFEPKVLGMQELYRIVDRGQRQAVTSLALTSKSDILVSGGNDGLCRVWQLVDDLDKSGKRVRQGLLQFHLTHQAGPITMIKISADDKRCVASSLDGSHTVYEMDTGKQQYIVKIQSGQQCVNFCIDDTQLLGGGLDGKINQWEILTGEHIREIEGCKGGTVNTIDVEKTTRKMFASGGYDRLVKVWNIETGTVTHVGLGHTGIISRVQFAPCGTLLVSASKDGSICIWEFPKC